MLEQLSSEKYLLFRVSLMMKMNLAYEVTFPVQEVRSLGLRHSCLSMHTPA